MTHFKKLEQHIPNVKQGYAACFLLLILIASIDYTIGFEMSFSFFYLIPVSLFAWLYGKVKGLIFSLLSAAMWAAVDILGQHHYSKDIYYVWNSCIRMGIFSSTSLLVSLLKEKIDSDPLTGLLNLQAILPALQSTINGFSTHHPFAVGFIDLNKFKEINDKYGHIDGDAALQTVAESLRRHLSQPHAIARIGGDEFLFVLPNTNHITSKKLVENILEDLKLHKQHEWSISISLGIVCCETSTKTAEELIRLADELMYTAKHSQQNNTYKIITL